MKGGQITQVFKMNGYILVENKADYEATTGQIIKKGKRRERTHNGKTKRYSLSVTGN